VADSASKAQALAAAQAAATQALSSSSSSSIDAFTAQALPPTINVSDSCVPHGLCLCVFACEEQDHMSVVLA
jgi:hypothetical protein